MFLLSQANRPTLEWYGILMGWLVHFTLKIQLAAFEHCFLKVPRPKTTAVGMIVFWPYVDHKMNELSENSIYRKIFLST